MEEFTDDPTCNAAMLVLVSKLLKAMKFFPSPLTSYYACVRTCDDCTRWGTTVYVPLIVIDTVILALTIRQSFVAILTVSCLEGSTGSQRKAAPILVTFFQDGITYFMVAFMATLVHILFLVFGKGMMTSWMMNFLRPLLSSMATRLLLNLHEQVSRTAHYSTDPPTTMIENHTNALSTVRFASLPGAKDVESVTYDVSGCGPSTGNKSRTGGPSRCDEGTRSDLKAFGETGRENSRWGPTKMDP
ncbi:hypothetical protein FRC04_008359 [Tulasnella sp. 424]|nr:hypothetical protein FRC04_008359 [Tulasnella sp. 424]